MARVLDIDNIQISIVEQCEKGKKLKWSSLRKMFGRWDSLENPPEDFKASVENLKSLLNDINCQEHDLITDINTLYDLSKKEKLFLAFKFCVWLDYKEICLPAKDQVSTFSRCFRYGIRSYDYFKDLSESAVVYGNFNLLAMLVKAGESLIVPNESFISKTVLSAVYKILRDMSSEYPRRCNCPKVRAPAQSAVISSNKNSTSRKYVVMLGILLFISAVTHPSLRNHYANSLRLIFNDRTDPIISCREVKLYLRRFYSCRIGLSVVDKLADKYTVFMPESKRPYMPRSLKHLCRCQVRNTLKKANSLPQEIVPPELPQELVDYLKLGL